MSMTSTVDIALAVPNSTSSTVENSTVQQSAIQYCTVTLWCWGRRRAYHVYAPMEDVHGVTLLEPARGYNRDAQVLHEHLHKAPYCVAVSLQAGYSTV